MRFHCQAHPCGIEVTERKSVSWFRAAAVGALALVFPSALSLPALQAGTSGGYVGLAILWMLWLALVATECEVVRRGAGTVGWPPLSDDPHDADNRRRIRLRRLNSSDGHALHLYVEFCRTCRLWRAARCAHCSICNCCIARLDHHCVFLGVCVGRDNILPFIALLGVLAVFADSNGIVAAALLLENVKGAASAVCWFSVVSGVLFSLPTNLGFFFYLYLYACRGTTMREHRKGGSLYDGYELSGSGGFPRPFGQSCLENTRELCR
jgi:hypothetical protein